MVQNMEKCTDRCLIFECLIEKKIVWLILKLKQFKRKSRKVSLNNVSDII